MTISNDAKNALLTPLDPRAYDAIAAPSKQQFREARAKGAEDLRQAAKQAPRSPIDPKLRFR